MRGNPQAAARVPQDVMDRIDALTEVIAPTAPPGSNYERTHTIRAALVAGLELLEKRYGVTPKATTKPATKASKGPKKKGEIIDPGPGNPHKGTRQ